MSAIRDPDCALTSLLDTIDDRKLRRVIEVVEATGQRPVLEPALAAMRPRLRKLRPQRPLTLARLLTVPFELALVDDDSPHVVHAICRGRLRHWQAAMLHRLDASALDAAREAICGSMADDRRAVLEAGRAFWPAASVALVSLVRPDGERAVEAERLRVADCLAIGSALVPLLDRLLPLPAVLDAEDKAVLLQLMELAAAGPPDRLGTLTSVLLRAARQPWGFAAALVDLVAGTLQGRLREILADLLAAHRASLDQLVERHAEAGAAATSLSPTELAADWERLADALTPLDGGAAAFGPGDTSDLRRRAAVLATERYAMAIESVLAPLPAAGSSGFMAAQKAREAAARGLAGLGRSADRLSSASRIKRLTEAAIERLVDVGAARSEGQQQPVTVEDARLIEILAGPDVAWQYLRPDATLKTNAPNRHRARPSVTS